MFGKPPKDDKLLKEASERLDTLKGDLKNKILSQTGDNKLQSLEDKASALEGVLRNKTFKKPPTQEMIKDFEQLQTILENYKLDLDKKKFSGDEEKLEVKEDTILDSKILKVNELLGDVMNRDFASLAEKWPGHTAVIASHRDVGDGSWSVSSFIKPLYNQVYASSGANLVSQMQPIYDSLEIKAKALQNSPRP